MAVLPVCSLARPLDRRGPFQLPHFAQPLSLAGRLTDTPEGGDASESQQNSEAARRGSIKSSETAGRRRGSEAGSKRAAGAPHAEGPAERRRARRLGDEWLGCAGWVLFRPLGHLLRAGWASMLLLEWLWNAV